MLGRIIGKFDAEAKSHMERQSLNPFSGSFNRSPSPRLSKDQYGKPLAGSKTEERGQKAKCHILREIQDLCNCIHDVGMYNKVHRPSDDSDDDEPMGDEIIVTFGEIFQIYTKINDKVVGLLIAAKKRGFLFFEKEILFQRRDDNVLIALIKPITEIRAIINKELAAAVSPVPFITREESPLEEGKSESKKSETVSTVNGNRSPSIEQNSNDSKVPNEMSENLVEAKIEMLANGNNIEKSITEEVSIDLNTQPTESSNQAVAVVAIEEKPSDNVSSNKEKEEQKQVPQLEITLESGTPNVDKDIQVSSEALPQSQTTVLIPTIEISDDLSLNDTLLNIVPSSNEESQRVSSEKPLDNTNPSEIFITEQIEVSEPSINSIESANQTLISETIEGIDNIKLNNEGIDKEDNDTIKPDKEDNDSIKPDNEVNGIQENVSVENQHVPAPIEENKEQERPTSTQDRLESDLPVHESTGEIQIASRSNETMEKLTTVTPDSRPSPDRCSSPDPCDEEVQQILESQVSASIPIIETDVHF